MLIIATRKTPHGRVYFAGDGRVVVRTYPQTHPSPSLLGMLLGPPTRVAAGSSNMPLFDSLPAIATILAAFVAVMGTVLLILPTHYYEAVIEISGLVLVVLSGLEAMLVSQFATSYPPAQRYLLAADYNLPAVPSSTTAALWLTAVDSLPATLAKKITDALINDFSHQANVSHGSYRWYSYPARAYRIAHCRFRDPAAFELAVALWQPHAADELRDATTAQAAAHNLLRTTPPLSYAL